MNTIFLDRNENQYGPAPGCYDVLRRANLEQLSLYSRSYVRGTKGELAERLSRDAGIPEDRLLLSYGSEDMLKQVVHCYLAPGSTLLLPAQSWWYYKKLAAESGGGHIAYPLHERGDRFVYDADEIIALCERHRPAVILVASPNNPTGNSIDPAALEQLLRRSGSAVVVLDEAYGGFTESPGADSAGYLADCERLVILRTFSKYYALAGLRIGYALAGTGMDRLVRYSTRYLGFSQLSEQIALAALDGAEYYRGVARHIREDLSAYRAMFASLEGYTAFQSNANFLIVRYPPGARELLSEGLGRRGIVVKFLDDPGLSDCIRITIGTVEQNRLVMAAVREIVLTEGKATGEDARATTKDSANTH
jgi:histidinol-phosphate aminotransferase